MVKAYEKENVVAGVQAEEQVKDLLGHQIDLGLLISVVSLDEKLQKHLLVFVIVDFMPKFELVLELGKVLRLCLRQSQ